LTYTREHFFLFYGKIVLGANSYRAPIDHQEPIEHVLVPTQLPRDAPFYRDHDPTSIIADQRGGMLEICLVLLCLHAVQPPSFSLSLSPLSTEAHGNGISRYIPNGIARANPVPAFPKKKNAL
jgi:hypothetical protein